MSPIAANTNTSSPFEEYQRQLNESAYRRAAKFTEFQWRQSLCPMLWASGRKMCAIYTPELEDEMGTVDITPSPRVLRMLGQIDFAPWQCLAELIDNSIDAFFGFRPGAGPIQPRILVGLPKQADVDAGDGKITVSDNGPGMDLATLEDAVRAGYSGNDPVGKMGLFGMGFNISTARLGRKTEVWTTQASSDRWVGIVIDFDELEKRGKFEAPVHEREKSEAEINARIHGTRIEITRLEKERVYPLIRGAGRTNTKKRLGKIYGRVMNRLKIELMYGPDQVVPWKHCTWSPSRRVDTKEFGQVPAIIEINETLTSRKFCSTCWVWMTEHEKECSACGMADHVIERPRTIKGWIGIQRYFDKNHYGIDLVRNGRVIEELDKSFFTYTSPDGDEIFEYPVDAIHWGGRIVGELEIDFVRVSHQKDSFDKLDPEWKEVVRAVRGEAPMQPQVATRLKLARNDSPMSRLFTAYRKAKAGLANLVPGSSTGAGLNSGLIEEYRAKFYAGEADFQGDEKWYELVVRAEKAARGETSGAQDEGGEFPLPGGGGEAAPSGAGQQPLDGEGDAGAGATTIPEVAATNDPRLSRTYTLTEINGEPLISVKAMIHAQEIDGRPFRVRPEGLRFGFDYCPTAAYFEESLDTPTDVLATELAHHFLAVSGESTRTLPVAYVARMLRRKFFRETLAEIDLASEEASSLLEELRVHFDEALQSLGEVDPSVLGEHHVARIKKRAATDFNISQGEVEALLCGGQFAKFMRPGDMTDVFRCWPGVALDGRFFVRRYSDLSGSDRTSVVEYLVSVLDDVRWLAEEGGSSVSKDQAWRLRFARGLASLRLAQSWRS